MKCSGDVINMNESIYTGTVCFNIMPMGKITLRMPMIVIQAGKWKLCSILYKVDRRECFSEL